MVGAGKNTKQRKCHAFSSFKVLRTSKAQIIGQIFIFILAGLVFILIVAYGYRAIQYFLERQEQVMIVDFKTDLEIAVEGVKRDYGTVRKVELKLPSKFLGVCFLDAQDCAQTIPILELPTQKISAPWAQDACLIKSANVFTIPREQDLNMPDIQVAQGFVCIPNTGSITIRMEGTGRKAKITEWT
jgi:hypothetical protein